MNRQETRKLIDGIFADQAIALGGIVAVTDVDDELVWRLVRTMDATRVRALARVSSAAGRTRRNESQEERPHPAIQSFLKRLGSSTQ